MQHLRIAAPHPDSDGSSRAATDSGSDIDDDNDQAWDDWVETEVTPCFSLFDSTLLPSATQALEYDSTTHGFDYQDLCSKLGLDFHQRARLINYIRKEKPPAKSLIALRGTEPFLKDDEYLLPVVEDDPLLQFQADDWSDVEDGETDRTPAYAEKRIRRLEEELRSARSELEALRRLVGGRFGLLEGSSRESLGSPIDKKRDDDSHYFESYSYDEIHAVMIQDGVRTSSYATFILSNPQLFRGATVLDVGCGTGILSLFAARAGAKRVFAVDASDIALKAEQNVRENGLENVITVIKGKVEEISLPDDVKEVDVIISEWMGYALLYECMLPSVLHARDRFLRKDGGVMAPSQCRIALAVIDAPSIVKERVGFWDEVYGFKMSAMAKEAYDDAVIDIVPATALISDVVTVKDLPLQTITARALDFSTSFNLRVTRDGTIHGFVVYFDTWFTPNGEPVPLDAKPMIFSGDESIIVGDVVRLGNNGKGSKGKEISFSTGPQSRPTHWKQTILLLREAPKVEEDSTISGRLHCKKSEGNSRELDVEIHYTVVPRGGGDGIGMRDTVVQMYKVR